MAKINNRKAVQAAQHSAHMAGPGAPGVPGAPASAMPQAPGPRPSMTMGAPQMHHHHEHPGGPAGANEDVSGMFHSM
jgi:hypothetical protein